MAEAAEGELQNNSGALEKWRGQSGLQDTGWKWVKSIERPRGEQSCNQIPLGTGGEAITKPWENTSAAPGEPPRKAPFRDKGVHLGAVIASPGSACWAELEAGPPPTGQKAEKVAPDLVTK